MVEASQVARMVDLKLLRRSLIFALALSLAGLGQVPLSGCVLRNSKLAECVTPKTQSQCDQMNMGESATQFFAPAATSCCSVSKAPIPQLQSKTSELSLSPHVAIHDGTCKVPRIHQLPPVRIVQDPSPPSLQSLLCVFLI